LLDFLTCILKAPPLVVLAVQKEGFVKYRCCLLL
jgi:hypothetical protein